MSFLYTANFSVILIWTYSFYSLVTRKIQFFELLCFKILIFLVLFFNNVKNAIFYRHRTSPFFKSELLRFLVSNGENAFLYKQWYRAVILIWTSSFYRMGKISFYTIFWNAPLFNLNFSDFFINGENPL